VSGQSLIIKRVVDDLGNFTALTPEVHQRFIEELSKGDWPIYAAFRAGIAPKSVKRWLDKGLEEAAVEPYATFAADVIRCEAELAGQLIKVVMDDALGKAMPPPEGMRRPNADRAIWMLQSRFKNLWGKDGAPGAAVGIAEYAERHLETLDEAKRNAARKILAELPSEAKTKARKAGFLV
jgi:hypothetical protein